MLRKIFNYISDAILRWRYRRLYCRLFWLYAKKHNYAEIAIDQANLAFFYLTLYKWEEVAGDIIPEYPISRPNHAGDSTCGHSNKKSIPDKYKDMYFLRDIDLHAEKLTEYPYSLCEDQCAAFLEKGLLFQSREEAEAARSIMMEAYFRTSTTSASQL